MSKHAVAVTTGSLAVVLIAVGSAAAQGTPPSSQDTTARPATTSGMPDRSSGSNVSVDPGVGANVGVTHSDANAGADVSPGVSVGSGDRSVSSGATANQQSTDINASSTLRQGASTSQSPGSAASGSGTTSGVGGGAAISGSVSAGDTNINTNRSQNTNLNTNLSPGQDQPSASPRLDDDTSQRDEGQAETKTGLDRADQTVSEHGQHRRDNARDKRH